MAHNATQPASSQGQADPGPVGPATASPATANTRRLARLSLPTIAAVVAALLAACGAAGGSTAGHGGSHPGRGAAGTTVSSRQLSGIGTVLVDSSGNTIYSPDQERGGRILCTGSCLGFWFPVPASASSSAPAGIAGTLATVRRPDGKNQLTYNGRPLYTFRLDQSAGQAKGNNFTDRFGSRSFTWRAVTTGSQSAGGGGTPSTPSSGGGAGYGY